MSNNQTRKGTKVKLTLIDDDGTLLEQWDVADDFGDVSKSVAKQSMANDIVDAIRRAELRVLLQKGEPE